MKNIDDMVNELDAVVKGTAKKTKLTESMMSQTVDYISRIKEAFGDMEAAEDAEQSMPMGEPEGEQPGEEDRSEEEKTLEERVKELEEKVAELEAKLAEKV
jgi:hypothetical protein